MKVQDKIFAVTGGANGLGRALVLDLLKRGAFVAAIDNNKTALEETGRLSENYRHKLSTHRVDLADGNSFAPLFNEIISKHGAVDGIINNAGMIQPFRAFNDLGCDIINKVMDVNFYGTLNMIKVFLPHLLTRPEAHIANISSMGGFFPVAGQTVYGASKAAVKILSEGLHSELRNTRVGVMVVCPGGMNTDIIINSGVEVNSKMEKLRCTVKLQSPQRVAQAVINGIEKNRYRLFVGKDAVFMNVIYKVFPVSGVKIFNRFLASKIMEN